MKTLDELDALHAAATAGPGRMVFAVRAYEEWPAISARLRAAEAALVRIRDDYDCDGVGTGGLECRHCIARAALGEP